MQGKGQTFSVAGGKDGKEEEDVSKAIKLFAGAIILMDPLTLYKICPSSPHETVQMVSIYIDMIFSKIFDKFSV